MSVHQCPKCELLFAIRTQLDDHLAHDHPEFTHVYVPNSSRGMSDDHWHTTPTTPAEQAGPVRHVLVVANQTLGGAELLDRVRARMAEGPCDFSILVPADSAGTSPAPRATPTEPAGADEDPATPQLRLDAARDRFASLGATVEGRVSDPNPLRAVEKAMARTPFDEVIISTLARGSSRWWRQDLPTRVQRQFHKPVTVISAVAPAGHR